MNLCEAPNVDVGAEQQAATDKDTSNAPRPDGVACDLSCSRNGLMGGYDAQRQTSMSICQFFGCSPELIMNNDIPNALEPNGMTCSLLYS